MPKFIPDPAPAFTPEWKNNPNAELIVFCGRDMLLRPGHEQYSFPRTADLQNLNISALSIGSRDGTPCYALDLDTLPETPANVQTVPVRLAVGYLHDTAFAAGCRAKELLHWRRQHKFCGHC